MFFRSSECLTCHAEQGYSPEARRLLPLELAPGAEGLWREAGADCAAPPYWRWANLQTAASCNRLIAAAPDVPAAVAEVGPVPLCRCCRLTRTLPDLSLPNTALWWSRIELAKRRLVSSPMGMMLPGRSKAEDPDRGLVFVLLLAPPGGPPVVTGHADGVITIDIAEADDARREQRRQELFEPYRTLLGHLRHESGHY